MKEKCKQIACFRCAAIPSDIVPECQKSLCQRPSDLRKVILLDQMREFRVKYEQKKKTAIIKKIKKPLDPKLWKVSEELQDKLEREAFLY